MTSRLVSATDTRTIEFTIDLYIDVNDTTTDFTVPVGARYGGDWHVRVNVLERSMVAVTLGWAGVPAGALGSAATPEGRFSWIDSAGKATTIEGGPWPPCDEFPEIGTSALATTVGTTHFEAARKRDPRFTVESHRAYRAVFTIPRMPASLDVIYGLRPYQIAPAVSPSLTAKRPHDVRLFFPCIGAELWASSSVLSISPYFQTLLASDFSETVHRGGKRRRVNVGLQQGRLAIEGAEQTASPPQDGAGGALAAVEESSSSVEDSDDETDDYIKKASPPTLEDDGDDGDFTYREIVVTETAYSTYRAVLLYLQTSFIDFAPLSSSFVPRDALCVSDEQHRTNYLAAQAIKNPSLPLPASPNSVYRLAHLLEIPSLCALSLANLKSQIVLANAATQLFSETSALYDDVRAIALDFASANWVEVKNSDGMKEAERSAKAGELPRAAGVMFELMGRVSR